MCNFNIKDLKILIVENVFQNIQVHKNNLIKED